MKKFALFLIVISAKAINISVVGSGYVGLVLGAGLAEFGHNVCCLDIDQKKIDNLNKGIIPIHEPGLDEIIKRHLEGGLIKFSTSVAEKMQNSPIVFIAVGTPMRSDGHADLSAVEAVTREFAKNLNYHKTLIVKSTVPVGTNESLKLLVEEHKPHDVDFSIASNPEFLREGLAVSDFLYPDRVVFGVRNEKDKNLMCDIYSPLVREGVPIFFTDPTSAEMVKYASNAFLAAKISYINEFSRLCDATGANIHDVAFGMGMDKRIGSQFLIPGPGFGGSCFPKDTNEIIKCADKVGVDLSMVKSALSANEAQFEYVVSKLQSMVENFNGSTISVLGLAFKANTDDVRDSSAANIIKRLVEKGANIRAYDPIAMANMKREIPDIYYASSEEDAVENCDAVLILTEWPHFKNIDWAGIKTKDGKHLKIFDSRNILDKEKLQDLGIEVKNLGNYKAI